MTKKTLADFKRDIKVSQHIELVGYDVKQFDSVKGRYDGKFFSLPIPEKMSGTRYVSHKDTTGFYLKRPDDKSARGSFMGYPKASQLDYRDDTFVVTEIDRHDEPYEKRTYKLINY